MTLRPGFDDLRVIHTPKQSDDSIIVLETSGAVSSRNPDGSVIWRRDILEATRPIAAEVDAWPLDQHLILAQGEQTICVTAADGAETWRLPCPVDSKSDHWDGERIWAYRSVRRASGERGGELVTVAPADGTLERVVDVEGVPRVVATTPDAFITANRRTVTSTDRASLAPRWSHAFDRPTCLPLDSHASLVRRTFRHDSLLILPMQGYGYIGVDVDTGAVAWEAELGVGGPDRAVLLDGRLHVLSERYAELDVATGTLDVDVDTLALQRQVGSASYVAHHDGVLYGVGGGGTVFGFDIATRALCWTHELNSRTASACVPRAFLDTLWIIDLDGALYPFALPVDEGRAS